MKLKQQILHCGFVETREKYSRLLALGDIVVSTAKHEFYGISIIEAVRAGCIPLIPDCLSYPELFPAQYLYENKGLYKRLKSFFHDPGTIDRTATRSMTDRFSWKQLSGKYLKWFSDLPGFA